MPRGFAHPVKSRFPSGWPPHPGGPYRRLLLSGQTEPRPDDTLLRGIARVLRTSGVLALIVGMALAADRQALAAGQVLAVLLLGGAALIRRELQRPAGRPHPTIPAQRRG